MTSEQTINQLLEWFVEPLANESEMTVSHYYTNLGTMDSLPVHVMQLRPIELNEKAMYYFFDMGEDDELPNSRDELIEYLCGVGEYLIGLSEEPDPSRERILQLGDELADTVSSTANGLD